MPATLVAAHEWQYATYQCVLVCPACCLYRLPGPFLKSILTCATACNLQGRLWNDLCASSLRSLALRT